MPFDSLCPFEVEQISVTLERTADAIWQSVLVLLSGFVISDVSSQSRLKHLGLTLGFLLVCLFVCFPQGLLKTPPVFLVSGESWTLVVMCNIFNQESSCCCIYLKLQASWHTLVTPAPERWRQEDHKFKIILSHIGSSRPAWATWALVSKTTIKS